MTPCVPQIRSAREPMADPAARHSTDAAPDTDLVEYLVVVVPSLESLEVVTTALADLVASAAVRILDLVCVSKSPHDGELAVVEFEEVEVLAALEQVDGDVGGLLTLHDIETASRPLAAGTSAMLLVVEDRWAEPLSSAARHAGGRIVGGGRIARPLVEAAMRSTHGTPESAPEPEDDGE